MSIFLGGSSPSVCFRTLNLKNNIKKNYKKLKIFKLNFELLPHIACLHNTFNVSIMFIISLASSVKSQELKNIVFAFCYFQLNGIWCFAKCTRALLVLQLVFTNNLHRVQVFTDKFLSSSRSWKKFQYNRLLPIVSSKKVNRQRKEEHINFEFLERTWHKVHIHWSTYFCEFCERFVDSDNVFTVVVSHNMQFVH